MKIILYTKKKQKCMYFNYKYKIKMCNGQIKNNNETII
jgi:hypothetical protein